jgi:AcrR family transcriptional regulator
MIVTPRRRFMRYSEGHKDESRGRLLLGAARGFRRKGFAGIGVDALAREAGATSGAFYGHFKSKDEAFREVVITGVDDLRETIARVQEDHGPAWGKVFVDFYLGPRRSCELGESCALQSLSPDVARAPKDLRRDYQHHLLPVAEQLAKGLSGPKPARLARAWAILSVLSGGVTLARAVADPALSDNIAAGVRRAAIEMLG